MGYIDCMIWGFKGFLIVFSFCAVALITILVFLLFCSLLGINKRKKE